ncbi:NADP-dependent 3-hydroxy acid dehydrogenase YdfG [Streptomyces sp. KhCrAH-43]|uniref:SDR family oxidoreductase n=1 Tax=Streptomyces TaxID=1883 RepID=UPI00035C1E38|nr:MULTISPECIES: SDR family oxidoreductase [unclassified Streptomyces]MYS33097.1 SDR family NAD(P)-dependent oxidoreductase [Streptomyces sp. SID4920]MYX67704.1 SDR family NAD(P)-dependent oxidoreductase [Streptomyces sp. SID8373]RAJ58112.1 NADP-dependent 3-hydroxy acid dehydrogenase YdfG [Streptomyces sp. KhCrAH-43]
MTKDIAPTDGTSGTEAPVTFITGGSSGIGAESVHRLLGLGHRVAATGRSAKKLAALAQAADEAGAGERLLTFEGDAADWEHVSAAVEETVRRFGRLDHAIANAGYSADAHVETGDPEKWRGMVLTNVLGPALLVRAALPALKESQGRIVLVGSVAGFKNTPGNLYSMTKFAMTGLAENVRMLTTGYGVGTTLIAPGRVLTPFWDERPGGAAAAGPMISAEQLVDTLVWAISQPRGVDVNTLVVRPIGQAN